MIKYAIPFFLISLCATVLDAIYYILLSQPLFVLKAYITRAYSQYLCLVIIYYGEAKTIQSFMEDDEAHSPTHSDQTICLEY